MERITIIGMGPIGVSIGLGLKRAGLEATEIVGAGSDRQALSHASNIRAIDVATRSLRTALSGAQMVILDAPLSGTRELLEAIGHSLEEGCVVTDTGTAKMQVMEWAQSYLPKGTSFVGGRPLPGRPATKLEDADAALFDGTYYCVIPSQTAGPESVKTVVGMVETLGASPLFLSAQEHDSFAAAVTHLPLVLSSALVGAITSSPSWRDISRLAGSEFKELSQLADSDPRESASTCLSNTDALVHWLDQIIHELYSYRNQLKEGNEDLLESFVRAWEERAKWEAGVVAGETDTEVRPPAQSVAGLVVGDRLAKRYRQVTDAKRRPPWKYPREG